MVDDDSSARGARENEGRTHEKARPSTGRTPEKKRQPPPPNILTTFGVRFTKGDENYDENDINAMVGTYWHDPIDFLKECRKIICQNQGVLFTEIS